MTENNQHEQAPKEVDLGTEQHTNEAKQNHPPFKRNTHMTLDPREDHLNN